MNAVELISGKEALIALANGVEVEFFYHAAWYSIGEMIVIDHFISDKFKFRLKPHIITINGIEVPAPFEPKEGETYWCFSTQTVIGYGHNVYESERADRRFINIGAWRTEEEIKQVVSALRNVLGVQS